MQRARFNPARPNRLPTTTNTFSSLRLCERIYYLLSFSLEREYRTGSRSLSPAVAEYQQGILFVLSPPPPPPYPTPFDNMFWQLSSFSMSNHHQKSKSERHPHPHHQSSSEIVSDKPTSASAPRKRSDLSRRTGDDASKHPEPTAIPEKTKKVS